MAGPGRPQYARVGWLMKATSATTTDPSAVVPFLKEQVHSVGHSSPRVLVCSRFTWLSRQQVPPQSQGFPPKALSFFFLYFSEVNLKELTLHLPQREQANRDGYGSHRYGWLSSASPFIYDLLQPADICRPGVSCSSLLDFFPHSSSH